MPFCINAFAPTFAWHLNTSHPTDIARHPENGPGLTGQSVLLFLEIPEVQAASPELRVDDGLGVTAPGSGDSSLYGIQFRASQPVAVPDWIGSMASKLTQKLLEDHVDGCEGADGCQGAASAVNDLFLLLRPKPTHQPTDR